MTHTNVGAHVSIDAPDGPAALALEQRLAHLAPTAIADGNQWVVVLEAVHDISELEASIRSWLREVGTPETSMRIDGREQRVCASMFERRRHRGSNQHFIG